MKAGRDGKNGRWKFHQRSLSFIGRLSLGLLVLECSLKTELNASKEMSLNRDCVDMTERLFLGLLL